MKDTNQVTPTEAVKALFRTQQGSRFKFSQLGLLDHLHDYTCEMNMTHEAWMGILLFLNDCRQVSTPVRREFILLSAVPGLSAMVDMIHSQG